MKQGTIIEVADAYKGSCPKGFGIKYTGEKRPPKKGEWYIWPTHEGLRAHLSPGLPDPLMIGKMVRVTITVREARHG